MVDASSVDVTGGERTPSGNVPLSPAGAGAGGICRSARGVEWRGGGRRTVGVGENAGGNRGGRTRTRVGRIIIGEANNFGTSNNESIEVVGIDVRPLESVVHPGEAG